jgi:hypothetical protein
MRIIRDKFIYENATFIGGAFRDHWAWLFYRADNGDFLISLASNCTPENLCIDRNLPLLGKSFAAFSCCIVQNTTQHELKHIVNKYFKYTMWLQCK